jgi:hypothetical protein
MFKTESLVALTSIHMLSEPKESPLNSRSPVVTTVQPNIVSIPPAGREQNPRRNADSIFKGFPVKLNRIRFYRQFDPQDKTSARRGNSCMFRKLRKDSPRKAFDLMQTMHLEFPKIPFVLP